MIMDLKIISLLKDSYRKILHGTQLEHILGSLQHLIPCCRVLLKVELLRSSDPKFFFCQRTLS
jgi:hypothetical protein